ncbi:DUF397 domain-containing protein [Streptomyces sp. JNUCC 64]
MSPPHHPGPGPGPRPDPRPAADSAPRAAAGPARVAPRPAVRAVRPVPSWTKSTYSGGEGGQCVEWAPGPAPGLVRLRDGKVPDGPRLLLTARAFAGLVDLARGAPGT